MNAKPQIEKFKEAARKAGADESEDHFDETIRRIAKSPPPKLIIGEPLHDGREDGQQEA